jgi:DNA primase large subunit
MKTKYTAKTADGREFTRTSARTYTHAAIVITPSGGEFVKFASSEELAQKAAASNFSVPQAFRTNPRLHAEETARMAALRDASIVEIVEVTA